MVADLCIEEKAVPRHDLQGGQPFVCMGLLDD